MNSSNMNDPRKRPFPLPSLLGSHEETKHKRRHSQSSEGSAVSQEFTAKMITCRLCNNRSFKTEDDFDLHLTMIHYRDQLSDRLGMPPYSCGLCNFMPTADDPNEEMILHYGCKERLALKFYDEECRRLPSSPSKVAKKSNETVKEFQRNTIICQLCNTRVTNDNLFHLHLTNQHFIEDLKKKLPLNPPFKCPIKDCNQVKPDSHTLVMHYGVDHRVSQEMYRKATSKVKEIDMFKSVAQKITCKMCKERKMTFVTAKSLKIHLTQTHFFPYIGSGNTKIKCPKCAKPFPSKTEFTKHFVEAHFEKYVKDKEFEKKAALSARKPKNSLSLQKSLEEEVNGLAKPLPKSREMKTIHGPAKERRTIHGRSNERKPAIQLHGGDSKEDESKSAATGGARQRMMDKWKSTSIDSQKFELDKLQEEIEQMKMDHQAVLKKKAQDFERWISQKEKVIEEEVHKRQVVEKTLEDARVDLADMEKQVEQKDYKISSLEEVVVEEHNRYSQVMREKSDLEKKLTTQDVLGKELCEFQGYIDNMKAESKDLKAQLSNKNEELSEQQELNERLKSDYEKQLTKVNKQLDTWKSKHEKVLEEKKEKMAHIREITKLHKELENDQKHQLSRLNKENEELKRECESASQMEKELTESKLSKKVKALEAEKKDNDNTVKLLESQRNALLDSLDRVQKIMQGFESVIKDKNEKIQDISTKLEEAEINLEEALQKINASKSDDKEKKESNKTIKQLQGSLQDYESRQFTNAKLISGLQREKQILEKRLKDFEERDEIRKIERELKGVKNNNDKQEQEIAKQQALLRSKTNELFEMSDKLTAAQNRIKDLEKEIRRDQAPDPISEEYDELRRTVSTLSTRYNQLKEEYKKLEVSSRTSGSGDVKKLQDQIETLKRVARDSQSKLNRKEKEVERLHLLLSENSKNTIRSNKPVEIKKEPIEVDSESAIIMNTADPVVTTQDPDPILVNSADSTVGTSHHDDNDSNLFVDVDGTDSMASNGSPSSSATHKIHSAKKRKSSSKIEDVTNKYNEEEDDIVCGICEGYDPPLPSENDGKKATYTTSWVGCDCGRWYHKQCTNRKRFTAAFSCKSVKRKCQKQVPPLVPMTIVSPLPAAEEEEDSEPILS